MMIVMTALLTFNEPTIMRHTQAKPNWTQMLLINTVIAAGYLALAEFAQILTSHDHVLPIWPPSGLAAFAAMRFGWGIAPGIFVGAVLGNIYAADFSLNDALWIGIGNTLAPLIAYYLMHRICKKWMRNDWAGFNHLHETISFILIMGGLNGLLAASWASHLGLTLPQLTNWAINDALSTIMFAPVLYAWSMPAATRIHQTQTHWLPPALISWLGTAYLFFQQYQESSIAIGATTLVILPLIFAALRLSFRTAITITAVTFSIGAIATALNFGPYHATGILYPLLLLQIMSLSLMTAVLITSTLVQERERILDMLDYTNATLERRVEDRTAALTSSHEQTQLRKLYFEVLSNANRLFAHSTHVALAEVLQQLSDLLVSHLHLQAAWIGTVDPHTKSVVLLAKSGPLAHLLDNTHISIDDNLAEGRGPSATVLRTGKTGLFDIDDPRFDAWRQLIRPLNVGGSANVPIKWLDDTQGLLTLYHRKDERFSKHIIDLLERLGEDLSNFLTRQQTEQALIRARKLKTALINIGDIALTTTDEQPLLQNTCEQLITCGLFVAAWVARPDENHLFQPLASAGTGAPNMEVINQHWSALASEPSGQTVTARAWRNQTIVVEQDYLSHPSIAPWRDLALTNAWHCVAAIPLQRQGTTWATLTVIGNQPHLFSDEMRQLLNQIAQLLGHGLNEIDLKQALLQERLQHIHLASHDVLTGLANRRGLQQHISSCFERALRNSTLVALVVADLDNFKPVNDTYGHAAGDELLRLLAQRMRDTLRKTDFIARLGGDEFVFVFEALDNIDQLESLLSKLSAVINVPFPLSPSISTSIGASLGITIFPFDDADADILLRHADQALYHIKNQKAQRTQPWALYQTHFSTEYNDQHKRIISALYGGGLSVNYQPIIELQTGMITGIEVLARLKDGAGKIPPTEFIPELNLDDQWVLTRNVIKQAEDELAPILKRHHAWRIAFNISPALMNSPHYHQELKILLASSSLKPQQIKLELLEVAEFLSHEDAYQQINEFKNLGIRIAIDDMGSAYSSLLRLKDLPVDEFKIDQNFVRKLHNNPDDLNFIKALVELGEALNIDVVAEGVETTDLLDALTALNVPHAQGHAIALPMEINALNAWVIQYHARNTSQSHTSLLGLYATHLVTNNAIKQALTHAPLLLKNHALDLSGIYEKIQQLGLGDSAVYSSFTRYHQILQGLGKKPNAMVDWQTLHVREAQFRQTLRQLITHGTQSDSQIETFARCSERSSDEAEISEKAECTSST
jgi:diguanylate cyclase (GGDEF)-like protein